MFHTPQRSHICSLQKPFLRLFLCCLKLPGAGRIATSKNPRLLGRYPMPYLKIYPSIYRAKLPGLHKSLPGGGPNHPLDSLKMKVIFCYPALYLKLLRFLPSAVLSRSCLWLINFTVNISWNFSQQQDTSHEHMKSSIRLS